MKPDFSNRKLSVEQKTHRARFGEAAAYAREAAKRHHIYAQLAKGTMKNAYNIALSDWFHPPIIHQVMGKRRDGPRGSQRQRAGDCREDGDLE